MHDFFSNYLSVETIVEIDDLLKVCAILNLKKFQIYLIEHLDKNYIDEAVRRKFFDDDMLLILNLFDKNGFQESVRKLMHTGFTLVSLDQLLLPNYLALDKPLRLELLKNNVQSYYRIKSKADNGGLRDIRFIFNFFDLIFHENRVVNLAVKKEFMEPVQLKTPSVDLNLISCKKDAKNCVTLVIEEKEIHVNSFVLTDNSPVFKAMLNSTFKEGQGTKN